MNTLHSHRLLVGTGLLVLLGGITYSCRDFLDVPPQGALDSKTLTNSIEGEALFLRAHYHFEGMRVWGAIPYYFENDTLDFKKTNVGVNDTTLILADLDSASKLLPATPRNGEKGRVTKWTALAYKGR